MSNEPTEEQKQAAREICSRFAFSLIPTDVESLAQLLAEREAKLEEHIKWLETQCVSFEDANINNQKTIKALNEENQRYCEQVAIEKRHWSNLNKHNEKTEAEAATLRARVVELEASVVTFHEAWKGAERDCNEQVKRVANLEAEAARVCRVLQTDNLGIVVQIFEEMSYENKSLHQMLSDHEEEDGIWIPRSEFKELPMRAAPSREAQHLARIAELEEFQSQWQQRDGNTPGYNLQKAKNYGAQAYEWKQKAIELAAREARHLADIKALQSLLHRWVSSYVGGRHGEDARSLIGVTYKALTGAPLAHYDDAKADAPAFEAWCHDVGGGAAADDGAVCKAHDAPAGHICRVTKDAWVCGDCESCNIHDPQEPPAPHDCLSPAPCPTCGPFTEGGEG